MKRDELKEKLMNEVEVAKTYNGVEYTRLFRGLDDLIDGGFVQETNGDPATRYDYETAAEDVERYDAGLADGYRDSLLAVEKSIEDEALGWDSITEEDAEYLIEWLEIWGTGVEI